MAKSKAKAKASKGKAKPAAMKAAKGTSAKSAKAAKGKPAKPAKAAAKSAKATSKSAKVAAKPSKAAAKGAAKGAAAKPATAAKGAATAAKGAKSATAAKPAKVAASAAPKKAAKVANAAPKSATKVAADAYSAAIDAAIPASNGDVSLGTLRLENYRKPFEGTIEKLSDAEKAQLSAVVGPDTLPTLFGASDASQNEMAWLEYMDVVDTNNGTVVANLLIWPYGDGAVVHHGTTKMIASIVQHGISPHETTGKAWMADFAKAWQEGAPRLGVSSPSHFGFDGEQTADADDE